MKKFFFIYFVFCLQFAFCQKISLREIAPKNVANTENIVKYLASQLKDRYMKNKATGTYYDDIFRINIINENYNLSLSQLDSLRNITMRNNSVTAGVMGSQFEIYINTIKRAPNKNNFDKIYEEEFKKKYEKLPLKSQIILSQYFTYDPIALKKDISEIITSNIKHDSIDISDAIKLCRKYNIYDVGNKTFKLGAQLLKNFEKEVFTIYDSIKVTTKDNGILTLSVVVNNKAPKPQSTILLNTIYSDLKNINEAKKLASDNYAGVILNTRGKYLSNNSIEPFEHEVEDINEAINWIIKQPWSNGKVGMIGGSYLGFSQWAATKKLHPALKTIIPQAAVGIGTEDFPMNNNIFTSYAIRWLNYVVNSKMTDYADFSDVKKWNSTYKQWYITGKPFRQLDSISGKSNIIFQRWLNHPSFDDYWKNMIPYKKDFSNINIPVLTITGYFDADQLGALYYLKNHYKYNKNADHYLIIGPYDHSGAQGYIKNELKGYTIDSVANIDFNTIWIEWFDYILKNGKKPSFLKNKINYQVMGTNQWKNVNSLENISKNTLRFYLENNGLLSDVKISDKSFSLLKVDLKDRSDADELLELKNEIVENKIYTKNSLIFTTNPLDKSFELSGNFSGKFKFSINKKDVDVYVYLYELMPDGKYFLLSSYMDRASYNKNNEKRNLLTPNQKETISISNNKFISKKIEKGSKLVAIVGVMKTPYYQINYGSGKDVSDETILDAKEPLEIKFYNDSYIDVPVIKE
ncbi:CocE/NonD family hydrolase [Chryseobacterium sp.]|uniref:CocE/NonD family hydrolase n=1 Tax=Chryseobacterium sp. TaxID=1871047 RepID=UPI0023F45887|nr:CocE/NonD family hydrolase [Chryseobacterium sp.]